MIPTEKDKPERGFFAWLRRIHNPLPGEPGSPYQPIALKPRIHVSAQDPQSALAASYERDAQNLRAVGANSAAAVLEQKVEVIDNNLE